MKDYIVLALSILILTVFFIVGHFLIINSVYSNAGNKLEIIE